MKAYIKSSKVLGKEDIESYPLETVHVVLKARILKWFAISFSTGPHSVRPLHHDWSILGGSPWHGLRFIELDKAAVH